ncbi:hypothetical protein AB0H45_23540 [Streptomyces atroolivaceus]|uniref:hypothetical protein n=1 Tax=Streptomyces atroolivaceus TaxID=66869 RepID=UPI00341176EB
MMISAGKMSGLWSGQPNTVKRDELDVRVLLRGLLQDVGQRRVGGVIVTGGGPGLVEQVHVGDRTLDQGFARDVHVTVDALGSACTTLLMSPVASSWARAAERARRSGRTALSIGAGETGIHEGEAGSSTAGTGVLTT